MKKNNPLNDIYSRPFSIQMENIDKAELNILEVSQEFTIAAIQVNENLFKDDRINFQD